jgi:hypothetical protein
VHADDRAGVDEFGPAHPRPWLPHVSQDVRPRYAVRPPRFSVAAWAARFTQAVGALPTLVLGPRANVLAEAVALPDARDRYLGAFQYAVPCAQVFAPVGVGPFSLAVWMRWALVAASACLIVAVGVIQS